MSVLVVISCSQRKLRLPAKPIPAIERYDGVFYRLIRKARREHRLSTSVKLIILSAKYGLITPRTRIPDYEQQMEKSRVPILYASVRSRLRRILRNGHFDRIYVNLGAEYMPLLAGISEIDRGKWASGGIGTRAQTLKSWLDAEAKVAEALGILSDQ